MLEPRYLLSADKRSVVYANLIWADGVEHKTEWYSDVSGVGPQALVDALLEHTTPEDSIMDMCCNQGRFLRCLWNRGYRHLSGFDIMTPAVELFRSQYAAAMPEIQIEIADAGEYLRDCGGESVDFLTTYSATLELIHPLNNVVQNMGRIARKGAILMLDERGHSYPRFWRQEFKRAGFEIISAKPVGSLTLFVLKK
jgi:SAM-dependent methyltransferase